MLKLGFHCERLGNDVFNAILQVRPGIIKTLDPNVDFWKSVRQALPDTFLIGRQFAGNQSFQHDPTGRGREFAEEILRLEVNREKVFDAWESFNEVFPGPDNPTPEEIERYRAYDRFQVAFAERLRQGGFEAIAMNFSQGTFLGPDWVQYFPGTLETYTYLGFHEYDWPTMWRTHQESLAKGEEGMWRALRYRRIMRHVRARYGNKHIVLITECGLARGVMTMTDGDVGWRFQNEVSEDQYWESLKWYNDELNRDNYVLGACVFETGASGKFATFESLGSITERMAAVGRADGVMTLARLTALAAAAPPIQPVTPPVVQPVVPPLVPPVAQPVMQPPVPPVPQPVVPPVVQPIAQPSVVPGAATAQYYSHFLLLPAGSAWSWYEACRDYILKFRVTWGESLDDAAQVHGPLGHVITCINASPEMLLYLRQQNPTARFDQINVRSEVELAQVMAWRVQNDRRYG